MLNITYWDRKTDIWVREKKVTDVTEQVGRLKWTWQGTSAEYEITDRQSVPPSGKPTKGKDLEEGRRDGGETN